MCHGALFAAAVASITPSARCNVHKASSKFEIIRCSSQFCLRRQQRCDLVGCGFSPPQPTAGCQLARRPIGQSPWTLMRRRGASLRKCSKASRRCLGRARRRIAIHGLQRQAGGLNVQLSRTLVQSCSINMRQNDQRFPLPYSVLRLCVAFRWQRFVG